MPFPIYDKKGDIPSGAEDVYEERDGKFHPKTEDTSGLKSTLEKERNERKEADKAVRAANTALEAAKRELDALKTQVGDPEAKTAELLKRWEDDHKKAIAEKEAEIAVLKGDLRSIKLDDAVKAEFVKNGGRPERADAALKLMRDRLDLADNRVVVKDADGKVSTTTLTDFLGKEFRKDMPELFTGTKASGGGAAGAQSGDGTTTGGLTAEQIMANPAVAFETANVAAATT